MNANCVRLMLLAEACEQHALSFQLSVCNNDSKICCEHVGVQPYSMIRCRPKRKNLREQLRKPPKRQKVSPISLSCEFENIEVCRSNSYEEHNLSFITISSTCTKQGPIRGCYNLRSTKKQKCAGLPNEINSKQKFLQHVGKEDIERTRSLFRLSENRDWDAVIERTKTHSQDAKWRDSSGWYVLQRVICDQAPFEVIHAVWRAFPAAIHNISRDGKTPLHCAYRWGVCDTQLFDFILDRSVNPTLSTLETVIDLPTDILDTCIIPFLGRSPLLVQDEHGWTALHWMLFKNTKVDLVQKFIDVAPQVLVLTDAEGSTPLHFACRYDKPLDVLLVLIRALPDSLNIVDAEGRVPLQIASVYNSNYNELVDSLPSPQ
uniref:Uncharacterized protein n=1 Tax=Leptocylindrus danicus TaxID=163516 RepID=A0A7S2LVK8_9STRA